MGDERTTPDDELDPQTDLTPEGEPGEAPADDGSADQSAAPAVIAQAEYTRATQLNAAIRRELGLPKGATQAEVIAALQVARNAEAADEQPADEEPDPRVAAANERAFKAELRVQAAVYGDQFANDALELLNLARTSDDVEELFTALATFRDAHGRASGAPPAAEPTPQDVDKATGAPIDMSEGDRAPRTTQGPPPGRRESGVVGAVRGLFRDAGAAGTPGS